MLVLLEDFIRIDCLEELISGFIDDLDGDIGSVSRGVTLRCLRGNLDYQAYSIYVNGLQDNVLKEDYRPIASFLDFDLRASFNNLSSDYLFDSFIDINRIATTCMCLAIRWAVC